MLPERDEETKVVTMHRSLDNSEMHPGFVDECIECAPTFNGSDPDEHPFFDVPQLVDEPWWWQRLWYRFVARWSR